MELVKIGLAVISLGAVGYGFYCLYKTKQTLEIMLNIIEAVINDLEEFSNDYYGYEHD